jgi:hypothetical protein
MLVFIRFVLSASRGLEREVWHPAASGGVAL